MTDINTNQQPVSDDDDRSVVGFMCLIDWQYEIGAALGGSKVFPSIDDLRAHHPMVDECGIDRVRVTLDEIVAQPKREAK